MNKIHIRAFRAIDERESCERFMKGHRKVLEIFGITEITSANTDWFFNPNSYVIIAELVDTGEIVGGARVHVVGGTQPLPIEDAVGEMDPSIFSLVKDLGRRGSGEVCGLWNAREVAGMGISFLLTRAAISIVNQLNLTTLFIICAERTFQNIFRDHGFEVIKSLGANGIFYYPKTDLIAIALLINDTSALDTSTIENRTKIMDIRNKPNQTKIEDGPKGPLLVSYNLTLPLSSLLNLSAINNY